ncbi:MAG: hypothetical protein E7365_01985 [Clostridiales bacterium]|nr:hypothetical protein [Clostridiales bacterium]
MEKYIIVLIVLSMLVFCLCTFPVFSKTLDQMYLVINDDDLADKILVKSEKWQANDYYVYKIALNEEKIAKKIPNGKIIKEYTFYAEHNIKTDNPFMQLILSGEKWVCGLPYVID